MTRIQFGLVSASLVLAVAVQGCWSANKSLASKYVKNEKVSKDTGGTIVVSSGDSQALAGTKISIPAGALAADTSITITLSKDAIAPAGIKSAGPVADFGPDGLKFATPATVTLPYAAGTAAKDLVIVGIESNGARLRIGRKDLTVDEGARTVTFKIAGFTRYGAGSQGNQCAADSDCAAGEVCQNGVCVPAQGCQTNADCARGQVCDPTTATCVNACTGSCTNKSCGDDGCGGSCGTCAAGELCNSVNQCVHCAPNCGAGRTCGDDGCGGTCGTCATGETCDPNGNCVPPGADGGLVCRSDSDCPSGQVCVNGTCDYPSTDGGPLYCRVDSDCPSGLVCDPTTGTCGYPATDGGPMTCSTNADCPSGLVCTNGVCEYPATDGGPSPYCQTDADCPAGEYCDPTSLTCQVGAADGGGPIDAGPAYCRTNADCPAGHVCVSGYCQ